MLYQSMRKYLTTINEFIFLNHVGIPVILIVCLA